jgi:hypothetical protein
MQLSLKTKAFNLFSALLLVTLFTTLQSSSCSKNDDIAAIGPAVAGNWTVSLYWDKKDETSKFSGYSFAFNSGGQVIATKGSSSVNGTWGESSTKLSINFGVDPVLSTLNKDWLKEEKTATTIKLKDDNLTKDERVQFIKL